MDIWPGARLEIVAGMKYGVMRLGPFSARTLHMASM